MANQNLTNADAVLKEVYEGPARDQLNNTVALLAQLEKNTEDIEGRRAVLSIHVQRSSGVGARAEGDDLPAAGNQKYAEERIPVKHQYARISVTGPAIRATKSDKGSFVRVLDDEMKRIVDDLRRDVNRQCYNDVEGVIARCGDTSNDTTLVLHSSTTDVQMRQFHVGMVIDIGTLASPAADTPSGVTITGVDRANKKLTISANVTTDSNDYVTRRGTKTAAGSTKELTGLRAIVDSSGTLFNINPSTYEVWKSIEKSNSGTPRLLTDELIEETVDEVEIESGVVPSFAVTSHAARRKFAAGLKSQRRYADTADLKGGFKGLSVDVGNHSVTLMAERDCPEDTLFLLNLDHIKEYVQADWQWADDDGGILRNVSNKDEWEAFFYKDHELATDRRNVHAKIVDLQT